MDSADKDVRPRRKALARIAPTEVGATGMENIFGPFVVDFAAPRGDHVALQTDPGIEVVGQVTMQATKICGEL